MLLLQAFGGVWVVVVGCTCRCRLGIRPDPERIAAVHRVIMPKEISRLWRFMGMVNQLGKSTPNLSSLSQPLRELLSSKRSWCWGPELERFIKDSDKVL